MNDQLSSSQSVSPFHLKETSKRIHQFVFLALLFSAITIIADLIYGNYLSSSLIGALFLTLIFILWINSKGYTNLTKLSIIFSINSFLIIIGFAEGLKAGGFLYFIPMLFAIPYVVNNHSKYTIEITAYFIITSLCFCTSIFLCPDISLWQDISQATYKKMFVTNSVCVITLSSAFVYLGVYFERKYVKALVEQINKAENAMLARTRFLSNMGHELRTPLNGIIGSTNLLYKQPMLPQQEEYINVLKYCSEHMLQLVNDVLDFHKIEAGKIELHPTEFNLKKLLEQSTLPFYNKFEEKRIELKIVVDQRLDETVYADDLRLIQVLNNMLSNALKFTEAGYVHLIARCVEKKQNEMVVAFTIEDTGIGINAEFQQKIFDSFYQAYNESTRKYTGTGLGLTISQRLLGLMSSKLNVTSEEGKGSKFSFTISFITIPKKQKKVIVQAKDKKDLTGYRILIAEDNLINMMIARKILLDWHATLTTAENGQEVLDILEKDSDYDLVLLDLEMPQVDGYTAIREIRKLYPHLPALAFTAALIDNEMFEMLRKIGFSDCILKPFQPMELLAQIRKHARSQLVEV